MTDAPAGSLVIVTAPAGRAASRDGCHVFGRRVPCRDGADPSEASAMTRRRMRKASERHSASADLRTAWTLVWHGVFGYRRPPAGNPGPAAMAVVLTYGSMPMRRHVCSIRRVDNCIRNRSLGCSRANQCSRRHHREVRTPHRRAGGCDRPPTTRDPSSEGRAREVALGRRAKRRLTSAGAAGVGPPHSRRRCGRDCTTSSRPSGADTLPCPEADGVTRDHADPPRDHDTDLYLSHLRGRRPGGRWQLGRPW